MNLFYCSVFVGDSMKNISPWLNNSLLYISLNIWTLLWVKDFIIMTYRHYNKQYFFQSVILNKNIQNSLFIACHALMTTISKVFVNVILKYFLQVHLFPISEWKLLPSALNKYIVRDIFSKSAGRKKPVGKVSDNL